MEIRFIDASQDELAIEGGIALEVTLEYEDLAQLKGQAERALAIERELPTQARTAFADADDAVYVSKFIETRAVNDALELRGIVPIAPPRVKVSGLMGGDLYTCAIYVYLRPDIRLTTTDPAKLKTRRVAKPGFSAKAAEAGEPGIEFVDDDKVLHRTMVDKLDGELPDSAIRVLAAAYQAEFERGLLEHNIGIEEYQLAHGLNEEQYLLMLARNALNDAHWNYVLDAVYVERGPEMTEEALIAGYEADFPGFGEQLFEVHDLRNELYPMVEKVCRAWALEWLRANVMR